MNEAIEKSITLILLIVLGVALKSKFGHKEKVNGLKEIVLSVALPATIFIALMKIHLDITLILVPIAALAFNFFMYTLSPVAFGWFGIRKEGKTARTLQMLLPSLAPGLSCFPLISEFLGEDSLAMAAMADVGNKFFVLIFLYLFALNLYLANTHSKRTPVTQKIKSLLLNMIQEPINLIMFIALGLISVGLDYQHMPGIVQEFFDKTAAMMTPLVLLFIGLAVQWKEGKKRLVLSMLVFRAGLTMLFSSLLIWLTGLHDPSMILLAIVIPLSSASFWPFAHISTFHLLEEQKELPKERHTFDMSLAVLVLALSLPFSTLLILGILSTGTFFAHIPVLMTTGLALILLSLTPRWVKKWIQKRPALQVYFRK